MNRPPDAPKHIPAWAWKRLHLPGRRPQAGPRHLPGWFWPWRAWKLHKHGGKHPPITKPPTHHPLSFEQRVVTYCHASLAYAGRLIYWDVPGLLRGQLFRRKPGDFKGAHADCSQFAAAIYGWCGNTKVTDWDATGSLWNQGRVLTAPKPGCGVIFGAYPGEHMGIVTEHEAGVWYVVGFGWQGAPDRNTLPGLEQYFNERGHPGVRYLDFAP